MNRNSGDGRHPPVEPRRKIISFEIAAIQVCDETVAHVGLDPRCVVLRMAKTMSGLGLDHGMAPIALPIDGQIGSLIVFKDVIGQYARHLLSEGAPISIPSYENHPLRIPEMIAQIDTIFVATHVVLEGTEISGIGLSRQEALASADRSAFVGFGDPPSVTDAVISLADQAVIRAALNPPDFKITKRYLM